MVFRWKVPNGSATHVLMDGGILNVPPEDNEEFYREYIQTIHAGTKLYVVEQKTTRFKFFIDFDYKDPEKLSDEDILKFCEIIHTAVGERGRCLIARTKHRPVKEGIKTGVHIHWPDLTVDRSEALRLRTEIILALGEGPWASIIDASVYGGSGLRMLWSHKKPSGDPYIPWRELGSSREFSKEPNEEILKLFSVRTLIDGGISLGSAPHADIDGLEEFLQRKLLGQRTSRIKKVQRHEHDGWYVQSDSKFCENIKREHKSNHVWFSIQSGRVSQRCFDDECREFRGQEHILPPSIVEQLKDVDIVGSPSYNIFMEIFPDGFTETFSEIRAVDTPIFGAGPGKLEALFE